MKNKLCGYVIDSVDYKDNDSIITILCPEGLVSLKARGSKRITSKMNSVLFNYAYSEFEVNKSEKNGYLTLLDGTLLNYPNYVVNSLEYMTIMGIISEGINKCSSKDCLFYNFKECLTLMEKGEDARLIIIAFLNFMLESEGVKYESDKCVCCLSKQVNSFDFDRGGFICKDCGGISQDITFLKNMRILAKVDFTNVSKANIDNEDKITYIAKAFESLENKCGIVFKGKEFLFRVFKMEE